jgi:uncharacterized protein (DUF1330 family)
MTLDHQILASKEQFMNFMQQIPPNEPFVMINILKFKAQTGNGTESGKEAYLRYSKNVQPLLEEAGAKVVWAGNVKATVIGDSEDEVDMVLLVEYPSTEKFMAMATSDAYKTVKHDREIALQFGGLWASKTINMI